MTVLIFILVSYIILSIALYLIFPKVNVEAWKGLVPVMNMMEWCKIIGRPSWWAFLLFIPIVNLFIFTGMAVDLVRSFGYYRFIHSALAVIYAPGILTYIGLKKDSKYVEPAYAKEQEYLSGLQKARSEKNEYAFNKLKTGNKYQKSGMREWVESIVFAVFAAAFIRMFLIEAYVIPTPSMEGSLNVGDFLFVSKMSYGIRPPMTVAMVPLLHNRIPFLNRESYLSKPSLPYTRITPESQVKRFDPFVFNWPVGDSVYLTSVRSYTVNQVMRDPTGYFRSDRELKNKVKNNDFIVRPLDKKDHYIKRCVAVAGDSLQIIDAQLYINGEPAKNPEHLQFQYFVNLSNSAIGKKTLEKWGITDADRWAYDPRVQGYFLDQEQVNKLKEADANIQITRMEQFADGKKLFPHDPVNFPGWTVDDFGPIWIPKKGATVSISKKNLALYKRIIGVYEHNDLEIKGDQIFINGESSNSYTFKQDYYWAMGDNRHNSEDSRAWGFVPFDRIVGKPLFIWFSTKNGSIRNGINWNRIFKSANVD